MTTAQELWDATEPYRREGGPGMGEGLRLGSDGWWRIRYLTGEHKIDENGKYSQIDYWMEHDCPREHAEAILGWHGLMWLQDQRCMPQTDKRTYGDPPPCPPAFAVEVRIEKGSEVEVREFVRPTMLQAIAAAVAAVLEGK